MLRPGCGARGTEREQRAILCTSGPPTKRSRCHQTWGQKISWIRGREGHTRGSGGGSSVGRSEGGYSLQGERREERREGLRAAERRWGRPGSWGRPSANRAGMGAGRGGGETGLAGPRIPAASLHQLGAPCPLSDAVPAPTPPRGRPLPAVLRGPAEPQALAPGAAGRYPGAGSAHTWARHPAHRAGPGSGSPWGWDARVPPRAAERDL